MSRLRTSFEFRLEFGKAFPGVDEIASFSKRVEFGAGLAHSPCAKIPARAIQLVSRPSKRLPISPLHRHPHGSQAPRGVLKKMGDQRGHEVVFSAKGAQVGQHRGINGILMRRVTLRARRMDSPCVRRLPRKSTCRARLRALPVSPAWQGSRPCPPSGMFAGRPPWHWRSWR